MDSNKVKKIIYMCAVIVCVLSLLLWFFLDGRPAILGLFKSGTYGNKLELDSTMTYAVQKYNGGVAVFGKDRVCGISNSGKMAWNFDFSATEPILSTAGKYILAAERGGNRLLLISGGKIKYEHNTENEILTASVNKKGTFSVVTKERGYKGCVKVYDIKGKELYAWHSASQNILSSAISEDGKKLSVAVVNTEDISRMCTILEFDMKQTVPKKLEVGDENLVANILYNKNLLLAIGDETLLCFDADGKQKFSMDYKGKTLIKYSIYSGGVLALAFRSEENGNNSVIEFYDMNGKQKGSCVINGRVTSMDTFGKYAAVTTPSSVYVISQKGKIRAERTVESMVQRVFLCGSRNRMFFVTGTYASMYVL